MSLVKIVVDVEDGVATRGSGDWLWWGWSMLFGGQAVTVREDKVGALLLKEELYSSGQG